MMKRIFFAAMLGGLLCSSLLAQDESRQLTSLDPLLPYQAIRSRPVTYEVDFSVVVTPPYKTKKLQVWLPIPTSDSAQEVSNSKLTSFPLVVDPQIGTEPLYGNKFACFEFDSPQGAQIIRHKFSITVWQLDWNIDPSKFETVENWPVSFDKYRRNESQAVVFDDRFRQLLQEIVPVRSNVAQDFGQVMQWVQTNFEYDHHVASLSASSVHGLTQRRGHCSDYHGFCASMGRILGVPARVTYGINPFPKNSPSHCKLEVFLVPYGWVSFDVSETQKLVSLINDADGLADARKIELAQRATARLESGFRDNTWFLQTRGTDYDLVPRASRRVAVVRTAYIEADGVPLAEPDPSDKAETAFSWMTVHEYRADKTVSYPFTDLKTLEPEKENK